MWFISIVILWFILRAINNSLKDMDRRAGDALRKLEEEQRQNITIYNDCTFQQLNMGDQKKPAIERDEEKT